MDLYKVQISKDDCWTLMNELGKLHKLHFINLNKDAMAFDLPFINQVRDAEESLRLIDQIERVYSKFGIEMQPCINIESFYSSLQEIGGEMGKAQGNLFYGIKDEVRQSYNHIQSQQAILNQHFQTFKDNVYKIATYEKIQYILQDS